MPKKKILIFKGDSSKYVSNHLPLVNLKILTPCENTLATAPSSFAKDSPPIAFQQWCSLLWSLLQNSPCLHLCLRPERTLEGEPGQTLPSGSLGQVGGSLWEHWLFVFVLSGAGGWLLCWSRSCRHTTWKKKLFGRMYFLLKFMTPG